MNVALAINLVMSILWFIIPIVFFNHLIKNYDIEKKYITRGMLYSVLAFLIQIFVTIFGTLLGVMAGGFLMPFIVLLSTIFVLYIGEKLKVTGVLSLDRTPKFYTILGFGAGFGGIFVIVNGLMNFIISLVMIAGVELNDTVMQVVSLSVYPYGLDIMSIFMIIYNLVSVVFNILFPLAIVLFLTKGYYFKSLFNSIALAVLIEMLVNNFLYAGSIFGIIIGFAIMIGGIYFIIKKYIPMMHQMIDKITNVETNDQEVL